MANLTINGKSISVDVEDDTPLLWAIRENVGLTGTKYGCGIAQCGACTVHVDGVAMRSCGVTVSEAAGKQITTIEGLASNGALHKVQQAWVANDVPQCGYCQSGMIMAVAALLKEKPKPTDQDINEAITNICRCGTFQQVREAIHGVAVALNDGRHVAPSPFGVCGGELGGEAGHAEQGGRQNDRRHRASGDPTA